MHVMVGPAIGICLGIGEYKGDFVKWISLSLLK